MRYLGDDLAVTGMTLLMASVVGRADGRGCARKNLPLSLPGDVADLRGRYQPPARSSSAPHQSPHFFFVGLGAESAGFVEVSAQSGLEHRGGQGGRTRRASGRSAVVPRRVVWA